MASAALALPRAPRHSPSPRPRDSAPRENTAKPSASSPSVTRQRRGNYDKREQRGQAGRGHSALSDGIAAQSAPLEQTDTAPVTPFPVQPTPRGRKTRSVDPLSQSPTATPTVPDESPSDALKSSTGRRRGKNKKPADPFDPRPSSAVLDTAPDNPFATPDPMAPTPSKPITEGELIATLIKQKLGIPLSTPDITSTPVYTPPPVTSAPTPARTVSDPTPTRANRDQRTRNGVSDPSLSDTPRTPSSTTRPTPTQSSRDLNRARSNHTPSRPPAPSGAASAPQTTPNNQRTSKGKFVHYYAGGAFSRSPAASALPLPAFGAASGSTSGPVAVGRMRDEGEPEHVVAGSFPPRAPSLTLGMGMGRGLVASMGPLVGIGHGDEDLGEKSRRLMAMLGAGGTGAPTGSAGLASGGTGGSRRASVGSGFSYGA